MKIIRTFSLVSFAVVLATPAFASFGGGGKSEPTPSRASGASAAEGTEAAATARQDAERWYHDAFEDIQKGKSELEAGKDKNAEKRFRRAIERGEKAIALDSTYHEAWNLVGYAARKLKDYDRAVASYQRCLKIKSDYAPAREYLGEAYLEMGKIDLARAQLAAMDEFEAPEESRTLSAAIEAWQKSHPAAAGATSAGTP